jgi:serine/threonine protein kinase
VTSAPSERELPSRLGAFSIAGVLGEGGSGIVYDATWGHRRVALKVLRDELLATARERVRFLAEAELLQSIDHPGVVKVLGSGTLPDGRPYLAMEHLDGESLARRIARGPLALGEALGLFAQLADAVAAMHARGLVHRDIKPENIFVTNGHAVLLDFGIAKSEAAAASTTTQEGSVRGTPAYMAPERFFGAPASVATDVYELAVVLYVMIAGRLPWTNVVDPTSRLNPPRPSELGHPAPPALETALVIALSSRAEARPRSVVELAERVRGTGASGTDVAPRVTAELALQPTALAATTAPRPKRRIAKASIVGGAAAVAAVAVVFAVRARSTTEPTADRAHDPWAVHDASDVAAATVPIDAPAPRELAAHPVAVPAALAAQLDLHPVDADVAFAVSGEKLRASAAMKIAASSAELAQLDKACGFDVLASVDELIVTGSVVGSSLAWDASARGRFGDGAAEHCIAALLGGSGATVEHTIEHTGEVARIAGGDRTIWVSHPDASTIYASTRDDHAAHVRDPSLRRGSVAKLFASIDPAATLWMIGAPQGAAGELFPGVTPPRSLYVTGVVTDTIDVRGGFRFDDAAAATTASKALRGKLDELATDPIGRGILGDSHVGTSGTDATFSIAIHDAFAAITLESLFRYLAQ